MRVNRREDFGVGVGGVVLFLLMLGSAGVCFGDAVDFEGEVVPLLSVHCMECHHGEAKKGDLDLSRMTGALRGGVVVPGKPSKSLLMKHLLSGKMPPKLHGRSRKLSDEKVGVIRKWIEAGAKWPKGRVIDLYERTSRARAGRDWWSFQEIKRPVAPKGVKREGGNVIDRFVGAKLREAGMIWAKEADRRTLIRRAYFDLLGLPPSAEEVDRFVNDQGEKAWERLIDRLLKSKHYGERWGRYWLDVVRFAESSGYERDQVKPGMWKYRDWVIGALNADMGYDRFLTLQLAGDEVEGRSASTVVATGMIRAGTWNDEPNDPADYVYERLEDMVHATSSAFLGLTVKCARCHDHKFDPIPQRDYYRMASFFWAGYMGQGNLGGPSKKELGFDVFGWTDRGREAGAIRLLKKGDRHRPGGVVEPGFLSVVTALDRPLLGAPLNSRTTHRRLQLAKWMTDKRNPLTARVMVNRIWLHHFGEGLVRTPNNFGFKGIRPTHPKLLDWLAREFMEPSVDGGKAWTLKRMHKLMMMSRTYRQASMHEKREAYEGWDAGNRLLWRFHRKRLDAEALRDALLVVSGALNRKMGGPSFYPRMSEQALEGLSMKSKAWTTSGEGERSRRSVYMMTKRSRLLPFMTVFDFVDTTLPCGKRDVTTVAPQALAMLNSGFVHDQSLAFADRAAEAVGADRQAQVRFLWRAAFGREPDGEEMGYALAHLREQEAHYLKTGKGAPKEEDLGVRDRLAMWLRGDRGVEVDGKGRVMFWRDLSRKDEVYGHDASQGDVARRPRLVKGAIGGKAALRFDGKGTFMHVAGRPITSQKFTIVAVVRPRSLGEGHREIFSNWNRGGRSVTSVFLGTTRKNRVRFTDAFADAGELKDVMKAHVLTAVSDGVGAEVYQNGRLMGRAGTLAKRDVNGGYVIGTQGNYGSEWWDGDVAELLVYDRAMGKGDLQRVWRYLGRRYGMGGKERGAGRLALASLCHVVLNTNEFIYLD